MVLDMNLLLGRWPFRPLQYEGVEDMLRLMDRANIDRAVITSLNSVFYYDAEIGNREVGEACRAHSDRFIPFAVINPNLARWREHLTECVEKYGVKGIKLHPDFHKFSLVPQPTDLLPERREMDRVAALMGEAMRLGLLLYIQTSLLDMRHHPGYCYVHQVPVGDVAEAVKHYSENTFIVGGGRWFAGVARELVGRAKHTGSKNFYIATDGLGGPWDGVRGLVDQIGSSRILFSSRTPILYSEASKLMIEHSPISEEEKEAILGSNAAQLLGLSG